MARRPLVALMLQAVLPRLAGLAVLGALVAAVLPAGRVLPVAVPGPAVALPADAAGPALARARADPALDQSSQRSQTGQSDPTGQTGQIGAAAGIGSIPGEPAQLPRGGTTVFPRYRLVGYSGGPGTAAFGRLGVGSLDDRVAELERLGRRYADGREPLPVLELIAVVAQPRPGVDGRYRERVDPAVIQTYLDAARRHRALLLLNIQPGRSDFLDEVKALEPWLRQPEVGLALDPEWEVGRGEIPGRVVGSTTGGEIDRVARFVSDLVIAAGLPEKVIVVHQLSPQVLRDQQSVQPYSGVTLVKSVDGIGTPAAKSSTWQRLVAGMPAALHPGFKLFYSEDAASGPLMTPSQVLALSPTPEYVLYE